MAGILDIPLDCLTTTILQSSVIGLSRTCKKFYNHYKDYVKDKYSKCIKLLTSLNCNNNYVKFILDYNIVFHNTSDSCLRFIRIIMDSTKKVINLQETQRFNLAFGMKNRCILLWNWFVNKPNVNKLLDSIDVTTAKLLVSNIPKLVDGFIQGITLLSAETRQYILEVVSSNNEHLTLLKQSNFVPRQEDYTFAISKKKNDLLDLLLDKESTSNLRCKNFNWSNLGNFNRNVIQKLMEKLIKKPGLLQLRKLSESVLNSYNIDTIQYMKENGYLNVNYYDFDIMINYTIEKQDITLAKEIMNLLRMKYENDTIRLKEYIATTIYRRLVKTNNMELIFAFFGDSKDWDIDLAANLMAFTTKDSTLKRPLIDILAQSVEKWQEENNNNNENVLKKRKTN